MATKIPVAQERLFKNVFICKDCSTRVRIEPRKIIEGKIRCRNCGKKHFRPVRKK